MVFNDAFNSYIMAVGFIGVGKRSTWRKRRIMLYRIHLAINGI
jgi:hypothetical protein